MDWLYKILKFKGGEKMNYQMTWSEFAEERMKTVNIFNEVECFKAIREVINMFFSGDKNDLLEKIQNLKSTMQEEKEAVGLLKGKSFIGWNVDYYTVNCDSGFSTVN